MMDIKIRAWDERNKKFWYSGQEGDVTDDNYQFQTMFNPETGKLQAFLIGPPFLVATDPMEMWDYEHIELPISVYIGERNKNGKEIYTGDIEHSAGEPMKVEYQNGSFGIKFLDDQNYFDSAIDWAKCLIIGNIYQNPELLQQP